ncbi:PREDICTED: trypsin delta/gamma-like [Papilio polytes]|uniref:trypsin delta/gamma-like n=1 Tax=Papilio polytes TaxID=76194 RepID=UPI00067684EF|nr:PREDICTED: trypsin delta/gamma-like [Papilio polytes]
MKAACIILTIIIFVAIMAVCVMVKFATDITVEDRKREYMPGNGGVYEVAKSIGVFALNDNYTLPIAERFPYVAAITRNSSDTWSFACFGSVILVKWVVTSAHCRKPGATHRILLLQDYIKNYTHTYPILFWRINEKYNASDPSGKNDIAVAKLNLDSYPAIAKSSTIDSNEAKEIEANVWKTVSTMSKQVYLTNNFDKFEVKIAKRHKCFESYGVKIDDSLICVDMSDYEDCFIHEFGPLYAGDKLVGILAMKPKDCDLKLLVFTNVSYHAKWILRITHTPLYG